MQIIRDGFIWLDVTKKAREVYTSSIFELYILNEDGSESLVQSKEHLDEALDFGLLIGIEVGHEVDKLKLMYNFMGHYGKSLSKAYRPSKKFNYEQFLVAHFSNLMDEQL